MDELVREFLIESQEGLDRMERCLTDLESRPEDGELLAEIFRAVHTIKGTTGFLGFRRLEKLAHAGENLLGLLRDGKLAAESPVVTGLLELLDGLRTILKSIEDQGGEGSGDTGLSDGALIERLQNLQQGTLAHGGRNNALVSTEISERADGSAGEQKPAKPARKASATRRKDRREPAMAERSEAHAAEHEHEHNHERKHEGSTPEHAIGAGDAGQPGDGARNGGGSAAESTLRVDVALLNRLMNLVGELVLTRNQVLQATAADPNMTTLSRRLDMVTADLRESVMRARMQPVSNIFSKVPRMVRDLSQTLGRRVRLEMDGQETELDKSLLEAIKDPLTHAVRNALDHGIETPAVRVAAGKDPEGLLRLRAAQEGSHVLVEIADDGAGIAVESVRERAIERGLITREAAAKSDSELLQMIFLPGFSTAQQVTSVSGRGVGMDVVRTNVEKVGGKVELDSRPGRGTTVRLRIPLTLAIIPALMVRSMGQSFALPQGALSELVHVSPEQAAQAIEWMEDAPVYRLRGQLLPLVFLDRLLGCAGEDEGTGEYFIAVLDADGRRFGLVVDGLADPEEIVVKPLSAILKSVGLYSGATVLGNAELALILDPAAIAAMADLSMSEQPMEEPSAMAAETRGKREYLVVATGGRQAAVPLETVLRIEQVDASRIEYAQGRPVINLRGRLLAVQDPGGRLDPTGEAVVGTVLVVVCSRRGTAGGHCR